MRLRSVSKVLAGLSSVALLLASLPVHAQFVYGNAGRNKQADLALSVTSSSTITKGKQILYSMIVRNNGPWHSYPIVLTLPVPTGTVFVKNQSNSVCVHSKGTIVCPLPYLLHSQKAKIVVSLDTANAACNSAIQIPAKAWSAITDPRPANNTVKSVTRVTCAPPSSSSSSKSSAHSSSSSSAISSSSSVSSSQSSSIASSSSSLSSSVPSSSSSSSTISSSSSSSSVSSSASSQSTSSSSSSTAANLFVTQDFIPLRSRQLLGGELGEAALSILLVAQNQNVTVTQLQFTGVAMNGDTPANNPLASVDRLELFREGEQAAFATATIGACGAQIVPNGTFCAVMTDGRHVIDTNRIRLSIRPRMKTDTDGAVSGHEFRLTLRTASDAVQAIDNSTSLALAFNDGDNIAEGEKFIGVGAIGPNGTIIGPSNAVVLSKFAPLVRSGVQEPDGTSVPVGFADIGQFTFGSLPNVNAQNGLNKIKIDHLIFTLSTANIAYNADSFQIYNRNDPSQKKNCSLLLSNGTVLHGVTMPSANLYISCADLGSSFLNTTIDRGAQLQLGLIAEIVNPVIVPSLPSRLQVSLENFTTANPVVSPTGSHILWQDSDAGRTVPFTWVDNPENVVRSTLFSN